MSTHNAIATTSKGVLEAIEVRTEKPEPGEILLKVEYASLIALDTYRTDSGFLVTSYPLVLGFNAAGTIAEVGPDVHDLAVGDRVAAFAYQGSRAKATQEYSVLSRTACTKVPDNLSLDAAATIPDNFVTAFFILFDRLQLPFPTIFPVTKPSPIADTPILIYGAGSTAGQYTIQLLKLAGYSKVIATASPKHHDYLRSLGATYVFDYSSPRLADEILNAAGGRIPLVMDSITTENTLAAISEVVSPDGTVALLLPIKEGSKVTGSRDSQMLMELPEDKNPFPKSVKVIGVRTFLYQTNEFLRDNLMPCILPSLLSTGAIQPNRVRLLDQGSLKERVETGLDLLRNNKVSGEKVIVKIHD